jgi:hypothetical protein
MAKIKVQYHDDNFSFSFNDGATMDEIATLFRKVAYGMGYTEKTIDQYIVDPFDCTYIASADEPLDKEDSLSV